MGTTIAGNQHVGSNYKTEQHTWIPGSGSITTEVELYEEERIFVYEFYPPRDQRDDGVYAIEFYYYYRKPTTQDFWNYFYDPDSFYIFPFIASFNDNSSYGRIGKFESIITFDSNTISLVGRDSGWIHVTLHLDEPLYGPYVSNGNTVQYPLYIGLYSPLPIFCWDNSVSGSEIITPYEIDWDFEEYEDDSIYDILTGGYLEECYILRRKINDYPSYYITYKDVRPESFNYSVTETAVMNVYSGLNRKANFKKLMSEIKRATSLNNRNLSIKCKSIDSISINSSSNRKEIFNRKLFESNQPVSAYSKTQKLFKSFNDEAEIDSINFRKLSIKRIGTPENYVPISANSRMLGLKRGSESIAEYAETFFRKIGFARNNNSEAYMPISSASRKHFLNKKVSSSISFEDNSERKMLLNRFYASENLITDSSERIMTWKRLFNLDPNGNSKLNRIQELYRSEESVNDVIANPFASRLFFRAVISVMNFWDWLRGKICEVNNVVTFFCPIDLEIKLECKI